MFVFLDTIYLYCNRSPLLYNMILYFYLLYYIVFYSIFHFIIYITIFVFDYIVLLYTCLYLTGHQQPVQRAQGRSAAETGQSGAQTRPLHRVWCSYIGADRSYILSPIPLVGLYLVLHRRARGTSLLG